MDTTFRTTEAWVPVGMACHWHSNHDLLLQGHALHFFGKEGHTLVMGAFLARPNPKLESLLHSPKICTFTILFITLSNPVQHPECPSPWQHNAQRLKYPPMVSVPEGDFGVIQENAEVQMQMPRLRGGGENRVVGSRTRSCTSKPSASVCVNDGSPVSCAPASKT